MGEKEKGNTAIVAEMIAEATGADLYEVLPADDHYPTTYKELTDVGLQEQRDGARPAYAGELPDFENYGTIFIGAPVWWGDWPMIMYTFFEENAEALRKEIPHVCHWFTVEDLVYLKRGGRVSAATALLGTALNVKPVLHVDDEGHLIKMTQVHGRKKSIKTLAEKLGQTIRPDSPIFISNADCLEDAEMLKDIIKNECGMDVTLITSIGSVIGAHAGPGTLALFFMGSER